LTRSSLLSILLVVATGLVLAKTYWLWTSSPWDMPNPGKAKTPVLAEGSKGAASPPAIIGTETIVSKNIFDPERGAGFTREAEANSQAFQRIRSMVLLGTAILGNNRFAIMQDGATSSGTPGVPGQSAATMRIKLGDTVEGFKLSEVSEKRVVFARGASTVEVPLDYFRKTEIAQPRRPVTAQTGVVAPTPAQPGAVGTAPIPQVVTPGPANVPGQRVPRAIPALPRRDRELSKED
jgi:hypothetical protein